MAKSLSENSIELSLDEWTLALRRIQDLEKENEELKGEVYKPLRYKIFFDGQIASIIADKEDDGSFYLKGRKVAKFITFDFFLTEEPGKE